MKKILTLFVFIVTLTSCKNDMKYTSIGMEINDENAVSTDKMLAQYKSMKAGDTITSKMKGKIVDLCSKKGCWMKLDMGNNEEVMVKFKDYGFFMPLDATGSEVVINGLAFVEETSVDELKHYAEDAGKSDEEISVITAPKRTYRFEADGVLLKK